MKIELRDILYSVVLLIAFILVARAISTNTQGVADAHRALCDEKLQYVTAANETRKFLLEHPQGIPGISRKVLLTSLALDKKNVYALKDISCSPK